MQQRKRKGDDDDVDDAPAPKQVRALTDSVSSIHMCSSALCKKVHPSYLHRCQGVPGLSQNVRLVLQQFVGGGPPFS